ncbi:MAG TPA: pyridoxamine 5'-phosphate oxidase family protein [Vicinamibacteria bacterium]|nr:pyridoxamine 5'-phosphate oxidase family protein [Vicinamibacteria bacterium]
MEIKTTPRTTLKRLPDRGRFDRAAVNAILDEALVCHVGFAVEEQPYVIPTTYARLGQRLLVHGSAASRMLRTLSGGVPVCVTVTLLDGLVLARSAFHHSMNYRSVVILGTAVEVTDPAALDEALTAIVEHVLRGRAAQVRPPSARELKATSVLELPIEEASAKVRTGPPVDDEEDYALPCWAGVLPLALTPQAPVPDPRLAPGTAVPANVARYLR